MNLLCSAQRNVFKEKLEKHAAVTYKPFSHVFPAFENTRYQAYLVTSEDIHSVTSEDTMKLLSCGAHVCRHHLKTFHNSTAILGLYNAEN